MTAAEHLDTLPAALSLTSPSEAPSADVVLIPWNRVRRSDLNPRTVFDRQALLELAKSIWVRTRRDEYGNITGTGIEQNLNGRPHKRELGAVEIAAGERRWAATGLLVEGVTLDFPDGEDANGRPKTRAEFCSLPDTYPMPFRVREMTDHELRDVAITENLQRENMDPLDEGHGFLAWQGKNRASFGEMVRRSGKPASYVQRRMALAAGLGQEGTALYRARRISLEQAELIAAHTGATKKAMLDYARNGYGVGAMRSLNRAGGFLVEYALFDVEKSGLRIDEGLLGDLPARFCDPKGAFSAQLEALDALKAQEEASGQWGEVVVLPVETDQANLSSQEWVYGHSRPEGVPPVLVLAYSTTTGRVTRHEGVARQVDVKAYRKAQQEQARREGEETVTTRYAGGSVGSTSTPDTGAGVREAAHKVGHQVRAQVLDAYFATHERECMALAIESLMLGRASSTGALMGLRVTDHPEAPYTPETLALAAWLAGRFPALFGLTEHGTLQLVREVSVFDTLSAEDVTNGELLRVFAFFTHRAVGAWEQPTARPRTILNAFAAKIGVDRDVQARFTLSGEFLEAYKSADLLTLIQTMPDHARPVFKPGCSKKDLKAAILAKAPALKDEGWVPDLVKFQR